MSAVGRLWRRAPLWRLALGSAATFAVLAALYPTPTLRALLGRLPLGNNGAPPVPPLIGSYPPFNATFSSTLRFGGRILPLPHGLWHELVSGREERDTEIDFAVLGRVEHGALTGAIVATASVLPAEGPMQPHLPFGCFDSRSAVAVPPADSGPHDCWFSRTDSMTHLARRAAERLGRLSIVVPPTLVATTWSRVEGGDLETVTYAEPPTARLTPQSRTGWMRTWRPLLRRGYDGSLLASDLPRSGPHDAG